jgi:uncharacterized protein (TIGR03435 family)
MRKASFTFVFFLCITFSLAQARREFEVASIRPVAGQPPNQVAVGVQINGSQMRISYLSLRDYIAMAHNVRLNQIAGPDWLATERFDIAAKLPEGATQSDVPEMLQTLLADRFQMKMHRESKEFPVYALEVAKTGLMVTESAPNADADANDTGAVNIVAGGSDAGVMINLGKGSYFALGRTGFETKRLKMSDFADMLTRFMDRPAIDMTGLKGIYDMTLELSPEDRMGMMIRSAVSAGLLLPPQALALLDTASSDSLSNSLKKLGLTLEPRRAPLDVLVIDQIQKTPTEN